MMSNIFSSAANVCVYVGEEDDASEAMNAEAISLLNKVIGKETLAVRSEALDDFFFQQAILLTTLGCPGILLLARSLSFHCGMMSAKPTKKAALNLTGILESVKIPLWMNLLGGGLGNRMSTNDFVSLLSTTCHCVASD
ncbi:hypothetical protein HD806DRAFT_485878 [Xylariaceae sp. AK1471]|nr:hypothetical protein HD806DRAFT_485878 [Xylariaceae sp. AK1471]